jgi:hypothetical protein
VRREARLLAHKDDVCIRELPALCPNPLPGLREQLERIRARELRVSGREERTDVLQPSRPEQRIGERMREDVSVRVARKPARVLDPDAAEHERHALRERVRVEARADAVLRHDRVPLATR